MMGKALCRAKSYIPAMNQTCLYYELPLFPTTIKLTSKLPITSPSQRRRPCENNRDLNKMVAGTKSLSRGARIKPIRLIMITRRFWPLVGGGEQVMSNLASEFVAQGHSVQLLTAQWEKSWPKEFVHREFKVTRIVNPKLRGWGTLRYMRALGKWLKRNADNYDAVLVSMLKHDAYAALGALKSSPIPIVIRAEGGGATGDCAWQEKGRFGKRIRTKTKCADAFIAPSQTIASELIDAGYESGKVKFISNGVSLLPKTTVQIQGNARAALADAHPVLQVDPQAPLVVYTGRMHEGKGLIDLVNAWPTVLKQMPLAKLWLIGEGSHAFQLWERIRELGLADTIIMPGSFDEINDVLQAANAYVLPSYEEGMSIALLEAMSASLPVVATDIPGNRQLIRNQENGVLVPIRSPQKLAEAIINCLADHESSKAKANVAWQDVADRYSIEQSAKNHLELIQSCIANRKN